MSLESNQISISGNGTLVREIDTQIKKKITELSPHGNTSSTTNVTAKEETPVPMTISPPVKLK